MNITFNILFDKQMLFITNSMNRQRKENSAEKIQKINAQKISRVLSQRKKFQTDNSNLTSPRSDYQLKNNAPCNNINQGLILNKQSLQKYASLQITQQKIRGLKQLFLRNDKGNKGFLSAIEFQSLLEECGYNMNITTCRNLFKQIKQISKTGIYFDDLVQLLNVNDYQVDTERDMKISFQVYDKNKIGQFGYQQFYAVANTLKHKFSQEQIRYAFNVMDKNKRGAINYQEFKQHMQSH